MNKQTNKQINKQTVQVAFMNVIMDDEYGVFLSKMKWNTVSRSVYLFFSCSVIYQTDWAWRLDMVISVTEEQVLNLQKFFLSSWGQNYTHS